MEPTDLINFKKLNEFLNLKGNTVRKHRIPKKYSESIDNLSNLIQDWMDENQHKKYGRT